MIDAKEEGNHGFEHMFGWNQDAGLSLDDVSHLTAIRGLQDVGFFGPVARHEEFLRSKMVGWKD